MVVVDGGDLFMPPRRGAGALTERERKQRLVKAEVIAERYAAAGLDAMALGAADWTLGTDAVRELVARHELPVLAANLVCSGARPYPGAVAVEAGGRRVGIVGVTHGDVEGCTVEPPGPAAAAALAELGPVDFRLALLPYGTPRELAQVAGGELVVDAALDGQGRNSVNRAQQQGPLPLFGAGIRGKALGILRLDWTEGGSGWEVIGAAEQIEERIARYDERLVSQRERLERETDPDNRQRLAGQLEAYETQLDRMRAELEQSRSHGTAHRIRPEELHLSAAIADHTETDTRVQAAKELLQTEAGGVDPRYLPHDAPADSAYIGARACVACHKLQHLQWSRTSHARAWTTLWNEKRALDDDCWGCHVTAAKQVGGPQKPQEIAGMRDVQCEACHGPGRAHAADQAAASIVLDPGEAVCRQCHGNDQDEQRFDYETYLPPVKHGVDMGDGGR